MALFGQHKPHIDLGPGTFPLQPAFGKYLSGSPSPTTLLLGRQAGDCWGRAPRDHKHFSAAAPLILSRELPASSCLSPALRAALKRLRPGSQPIIEARSSASNPPVVPDCPVGAHSARRGAPAWFSFQPINLETHPVALGCRERLPPGMRACPGPSGLSDYVDAREDPPHFSRRQTTARS